MWPKRLSALCAPSASARRLRRADRDRNLDARVDLWACGVLMYESLTGKRPYHAANYNALLLQILSTNPRPARELRPSLPSGFDDVR